MIRARISGNYKILSGETKSTRDRSAPNECHAGQTSIRMCRRGSFERVSVLRIGAIARAYTAVLSVATHTGMWTGQMIRLTSRAAFRRSAGSLGWGLPATQGAPSAPCLTGR